LNYRSLYAQDVAEERNFTIAISSVEL
jgi:hypothetical protein